MSNFPKLVPAFTAQVVLGNVSPIGALAKGSTQVHAPFGENAGSLVSEPAYPLKVDAVFLHGADYIRVDPDGAHGRLEVASVAKDKASGAAIRFDYVGVVDLSGPAGTVLRDEPGAKTTEFGDVFSQVKFETGHEALKELQNKLYVGSGRFILEEGKPVVVEYKISEIAA